MDSFELSDLMHELKAQAQQEEIEEAGGFDKWKEMKEDERYQCCTGRYLYE